MSSTKSKTGKCLCGSVAYTIKADEPLRMAQCHCKDCQRASGGGSMPAPVRAESSKILAWGATTNGKAAEEDKSSPKAKAKAKKVEAGKGANVSKGGAIEIIASCKKLAPQGGKTAMPILKIFQVVKLPALAPLFSPFSVLKNKKT